LFTLKRALSAQHFIDHTTKCPDIGTFVDNPPLRLLGRHVGCRTEDYSGPAHQRCRRDAWVALHDTTFVRYQTRQTEIEDLHHASLCDFDVRRLEIAMDDALRMCSVKSVNNLCCNC